MRILQKARLPSINKTHQCSQNIAVTVGALTPAWNPRFTELYSYYIAI